MAQVSLSRSTVLWQSSGPTSQYLTGGYTRPELPLINHVDKSMASTTAPSVEQLIRDMKVDGFFLLKDAAKGSEAEGFARKHFPITTVEGLEFCKVHTFGDPVSRAYPLSSHLI